MSTTTAIPRGDTLLSEMDAKALHEGPLLVASDGTEYSMPALEAALEMRYRTKAPIRVLAVLEPVPVVPYEFGALLPPPETIAAARDELRNRVRAQVHEVAGTAADWTIDVRDGDPAEEITRAASEARARLIVLGVRHRDFVDRVLGRETSLRVLQRSRIPVLVVPSGFTHVPTRMLVATDFSAASVIAARTALELFDTISLVYLVHVAPHAEVQPDQYAAWVSVFGEQVSPGFERVKAELGVRPGLTVETVTLQGKASREILKFARSTRIDLVVTGSRGAGFVNRLLVGSTARGLMRGVPCAVMAVRPPANLDTPYALLEPNRDSIPEERWASELAAFTRRNAGRRASIEVDDPEFGAQAQEHDYPLLGVAYDHNDHRVEIMVGDFTGVSRHLTRGIGGVHSIDILRDARERDWILRIAHGDGQTILTLQ